MHQVTDFTIMGGIVAEQVDLDHFDRRIIAIIRRNNLEPARTIAAQVGLSESAVLRRLRRLRATGVIMADVAVIDPARLAPSITIHVLVELNQSGLRMEQDFAARLADREEVIGAWNVTGRTDFLLTVTVPSIEAYQRFSDEVLAADDNVRDFETLVTLREIVRPDYLRSGHPL
ncbi:Lrp/AsnC family transcriptional regulator [Novosphingobium terrae]|jgi:Lrp/AsnC family transcriptional regulator, leucine-responsive regulatory protein|uniref:Lrp/AsnC family transcriptional regulator n=1 Tax=Novosphingobium terrae TaxID=2726189 RepID=UPI0019815104|nr:Lrp/AsnC family transcriptional regulator [Novosphingobium terrae]